MKAFRSHIGTAQHPARTQMSTVQVKLSKRVVDRALAFKPDYDSNTAHLSRLIESAIDNGNTLGKPSRGEVLPSSSLLNKEEERARAELVNRPPSPPAKSAGDPFTKKTISLELIPDDLLDDSDLLLDFWKELRKSYTFHGDTAALLDAMVTAPQTNVKLWFTELRWERAVTKAQQDALEGFFRDLCKLTSFRGDTGAFQDAMKTCPNAYVELWLWQLHVG